MNGDNSMSRIPDIIIEESSRLNDIITDFLNFARPKEPNRYPCRIEDVINKTIHYLSSQIQESGHSVQTQFDKKLPVINADTDMLYQAFLNIFINAMQAMPDGGTLSISAKSANGGLWVTFDDQGSGIAKDVMEKIWDPFYTTKDKGTGLGLGIVKNIIEAHNGQIRIDNRAEGGARVSVRLPIQEENY